MFIRYLRRAPFRPARYLVPAALAVALMLAADANEWPQFYGNYSTEQPLTDFYSDYAVSLATRVLLAGTGVFLAAYVLDVFLHLLQGHRRLAPFSLPQALAMAVLGGGVQRLLAAIESLIPGDRLTNAMWSPPPVEAGQQEGRKAHHEIHGFLAKVAHAEIVVGLRPHFLQGDELGCREVVQVHLRMSTYSATARTMAMEPDG